MTVKYRSRYHCCSAYNNQSMMLNHPSPTVLLLVACLTNVVFCQNGNLQREHLRLLGKNANGAFVNTSSCLTLAATILRCELNSSSLIIDPGTGIALDEVDIRLCLCDSSVSVVYYLTDETNITMECSQCPFQLIEGGLELDHFITVFIKERDRRNETNIGIVVLVGNDKRTTMFNGTIPLTQQEDTCGNSSKGPPDPGTCGTTTTQLPTEPTTDPMTASTSTTSGPAVNSGIIYAAIIVPILFVIAAIIILSLFFVCLHWIWKNKDKNKKTEWLKDQLPSEVTLLTTNSKVQ